MTPATTSMMNHFKTLKKNLAMNHPAMSTKKTAIAVERVAVIIYKSYLVAPGEGAAVDSEAAGVGSFGMILSLTMTFSIG